jgi:hypothetical protein
MKGVIMNVLMLKLVTGEEVLGELVSKDDSTVTLKNVVGVAVVRGKDGNPNVGFTPFPIHAEPEANIERVFQVKHIVYQYDPAPDFKKNYDQIFGAGIIVPEEKKLILG